MPIMLVAVFLVAAPFQGMALGDISAHLLVGGAVMIVGYFLYALRALPAGLVKLLAAMSVWFGPSQALFGFFMVFSLGGSAFAKALCLLKRGENFQVPMAPPALAAFALMLGYTPFGAGLPQLWG
jgi:prepilin peptidase CpaA